mgnify:CR=1 FL=1
MGGLPMINGPTDIQLEARINLYPDGIIRWTDESEEYVYEGGSGSQPTQSEIDAEVKRLQAEYDAQEYARNRATEYPAIAEQLDLLYHDMTAGKGTKAGNWYKAVKKVKTDNPK